MKTVITFGTFDVFHVGHVNILQRAAALGDALIVGISTDELNFSKKQRYPIYNQRDRMKIVNGMRYINLCFFEESLEQKREYILKYDADVLVVYLERTPSVSTTQLIEVISSSDS